MELCFGVFGPSVSSLRQFLTRGAGLLPKCKTERSSKVRSGTARTIVLIVPFGPNTHVALDSVKARHKVDTVESKDKDDSVVVIF